MTRAEAEKLVNLTYRSCVEPEGLDVMRFKATIAFFVREILTEQAAKVVFYVARMLVP